MLLHFFPYLSDALHPIVTQKGYPRKANGRKGAMSMGNAHFRHEKKHYISKSDHIALRQRLRAVMSPDPHTGADGVYQVHSLYFDDWRDTALREKLEGAPRREKFRIRYYNDDLSYIKLEKKSKIRGLCQKESTVITEEECRLLMAGQPQQIEPGGSGAADGILCQNELPAAAGPHLRGLSAGGLLLWAGECARHRGL